MIAVVMILSQTSMWVFWAVAAFLGLLVGVLVWVFVVVLLGRAARRRIEKVVSGPRASAETITSRAPNRVQTQEHADASVHPSPELAIETLEIDALPRGGAAYETRRAAYLNRGPAIRRVYRRTVVMLAIPIALVLVGDGALPRDVHRIPLWVPILLAVTLGVVYLAAAASPPRRSIGPLVMPILGALWVALAAGAVWTSVAEHERRWWIILIAIGTTMAVTFAWLRWARMRLEARYPIYAPLNLLFLRVFGHSDVYSLGGEWRPFGPFLMLGGPDTAGQSMHDMYKAFAGRAHEVVVENAAELDDALGGLASGLDSHLRYPAHAIQCTDSTWAAALERLLSLAHVIAMDLSGFSSARRGSAYEIGRLVDEVPSEQVTFFVFDTTDVEALEQTVRAAWDEMAAVSPNRRAHPGRLRIVNSRGFVGRARSDPKLADPIVREQFVEDLGDRIRGLLCDAAEAGLTSRNPEYAVHADVIDWGRTGIPSIVRRVGVWVVGLGAMAVGIAVLSGSHEARWVAEGIAGLAWILAIDRASLTRSETVVGKGRWHRRSPTSRPSNAATPEPLRWCGSSPRR
jgi:hypothetical protein